MAPRLTWKLELAALPLMVRPLGSAEASRVELVFRGHGAIGQKDGCAGQIRGKGGGGTGRHGRQNRPQRTGARIGEVGDVIGDAVEGHPANRGGPGGTTGTTDVEGVAGRSPRDLEKHPVGNPVVENAGRGGEGAVGRADAIRLHQREAGGVEGGVIQRLADTGRAPAGAQVVQGACVSDDGGADGRGAYEGGQQRGQRDAPQHASKVAFHRGG